MIFPKRVGAHHNSNLNIVIGLDALRTAYKNLLISNLAIFINATILSAVFWFATSDLIFIVWYLLHLSVILIRINIYRKFINTPSIQDINFWKNKFFVGLFLSAGLWGIAPMIMIPYATPMLLSFLVIILAGLSSGAISSLASLRFASEMYLSILILPLIVSLLLENIYEYYLLSILISFFWLLLIVISKRMHEHINNALRTQYLHEEALQDLQITEERFETIFKEAPIGIFYYNTDLIVIESNNEMLEILKIPYERMIGLDLKKLPDTSLNQTLVNAINGQDTVYEGPYTTMVNKINLWLQLRTSPIYDSHKNISGGVGIVSDITSRIMAEEKMKHQAYFDALTDIPNRFLLKDRIEQSLAHYRRHNTLLAVMFLDLDHFKSINDSLGHHIGDALLIETAVRLTSICREGDTVARLGGDEFVILLDDLGNDPLNAAKKAEIIAEKIHNILTLPFDVGQTEAIITTSSIGISIVNPEINNSDDLLKYADTAMYQAKKDGRNTTRFYQEQMDQWIKKRLFLENSLRNAIKNSELELYYQPVIEIETKQIIGAEALIRWNHPELGIVLPDEIISIAEESGLIVSIGEWVLYEACQQFVRWRSENRPSRLERIAVNVSAVQFKQIDFVDKVIAIVASTGILPYMLELELTETSVIDSVNTVADKMNRLRKAGIGISMDDFGTGYSSLGYLKRLPFTTLKIDRSFICDIIVDNDDAVLVETILTMAAIFKLDVIAEGVETIEQFKFLEEHNCRYFQGYLCSKPVQATTFESLLKYDVQSCHTKK